MTHDRTGSARCVSAATTSTLHQATRANTLRPHPSYGVTTVEHIALLIIGGIFALSLIVPVAFIVYMGALILFSDLSDDE